MATSTGKGRCIICEKEKSAVRCEGCLQIFCRVHLNDHCQELSQQLDEIEFNRDLFRQTLNEQIENPQKHFLIKQIEQWELNSIEIIQKIAKECKEKLFQYTNEHFNRIEINLNQLTNQLKEIRRENDFNEMDLNQLKEKLTKLEVELDQIPNISIQQHSTSFIKKISVVVIGSSGKKMFDFIVKIFLFLQEPIITSSSSPHININTKWKQNGLTIAGGNGKGNQFNQLSRPQGIYVDDDHQCIYIADYDNHRIVQWKFDAKMGQIAAGGNGEGDRMDQLNQPTDVIVDKKTDSLVICDCGNRRVVRWSHRNGIKGETIISDIDCWGLTIDNTGALYVSDWKKHEVRQWKKGETIGTIVAGGNQMGNQLNQLNVPTYLFVDEDHSVYVADSNNNRVIKWMKGTKEGIIVAGGQGEGDRLTQFYYPQGLIIDHLCNMYVADFCNDRIMCWPKESKKGRVIVGGNRSEEQLNQFRRPVGLSFDRQGNLYAADWRNHCIQKFEIDLH
jgi:sugar lactone lactonase YvrE